MTYRIGIFVESLSRFLVFYRRGQKALEEMTNYFLHREEHKLSENSY